MPRHLLLSAISVAVFAGCAADKARGPQGSFSVKVLPYFGKDVRVSIQAYSRDDKGQRGPALATHQVTDDGITGFVLPLGRRYGVQAYADLDRDGRRSTDDPAATLENLEPVADLHSTQPPHVLTLPGTGVGTDWPGRNDGATDASTAIDRSKVQGALQSVHEAAPSLPIPPLPVPPPPQ